MKFKSKLLLAMGFCLLLNIISAQQFDSTYYNNLKWRNPVNADVYKPAATKTISLHGVVYTLATSHVDSHMIWAYNDNGQIQVTSNNGKSWGKVAPPQIISLHSILLVSTSYTDTNTAYLAINNVKDNDLSPHIFKTSDAGKSWKEIIHGLPNAPVYSIAVDTYRKGLLFACSEKAIYFSADDGAHWQSLQLNMSAIPVRNLSIIDNDVVAIASDNSIWVLNDISPLRQLTPEQMKKPVILYGPAPAYRGRIFPVFDTIFSDEELFNLVFPNGAIIDYYLKERANVITIDIYDGASKLVRQVTNLSKPGKKPILSGEAGAHRFVWDMRYEPIDEHDTATSVNATVANSPYMLPGIYTVSLRANNVQEVQAFYLVMDAGVKASADDLKQQYELSMICYEQKKLMILGTDALNSLQGQITQLLPNVNDTLKIQLKKISEKLYALQSTPASSKNESLNSLKQSDEILFNTLQSVDVAPSEQCAKEVNQLHNRFEKFGMLWDLVNADIGNINRDLEAAGLRPLKIRQ